MISRPNRDREQRGKRSPAAQALGAGGAPEITQLAIDLVVPDEVVDPQCHKTSTKTAIA